MAEDAAGSFRVSAEQRLDRLLAECLGLSRSRARTLLARGAVRVDGRVVVDPGRRLAPGQRVEWDEDPAVLDRPIPVDAPLPVLVEGEGWLAVDKPAGLPTHPLDARDADSALQRLLGRWPGLVEIGERGLRGGVVHRLDVDTSGVLVFATTEEAWARWRRAFGGHRVEKVYRAVVHGRPPEHLLLELDLEIVRHRPARVRARPAGEGGPDARRCVTRIRTLERFADAALVEARPRSGFLHQIRASLAAAGHPLLGDPAYGGKVEAAPRHLLHAARVVYGTIQVEAPDPADLQGILEELREGGAAGEPGLPVAY